MNHKNILRQPLCLMVVAGLFFGLVRCGQGGVEYTNGVGVYPGSPAEDFSPRLVPDKKNYRNLAKLRPAFHSSAYDYNLTAQLVTDGIITSEQPIYIDLSTNLGSLPKNEREWLLDHNSITEYTVPGQDIYLQLEMSEPSGKEVTAIGLNGNVAFDEKKPGGWQFACHGSNDGVAWVELGKVKGGGLPGFERPNPFARMMAPPRPGARRRTANPFMMSPYGNDSTAPRPSFTFNFRMPKPERAINQNFVFDGPASYRFYRVSLSAKAAESWRFGDFDFFSNGEKLKMAPSYSFKSAWMAANSADSWVYVDLGSASTFDLVKLYWINKAHKGSIQVSDDNQNWEEVASLPGSDTNTDEISLATGTQGRYVRLKMDGNNEGIKYSLSELEVMGKGGLVPVPKNSPPIAKNKMVLSGGNWKIQRASEVNSTGDQISKIGFANNDWVVATVPGTVLVSYWNAGALPDPNFGDNQLQISESFFNSDFWYRNEFDVPASLKGERMFLNFDGINWKAKVFVNGNEAGSIDGAFIRGKFDVTGWITPGEKNAIAVYLIKNENFGVIKEQTALSTDKNGGILGADNPTYHASIGWDWIPTIRGRNIGIWNDVFLSATGSVTIENPFVQTDLNLPDTTAADLSFEVALQNHKSEPVAGILSGKYGEISFETEVSLGANESKIVKLNPSTHPALHFNNPKLWWPKGYGAPNLYDVELEFKIADGVSDFQQFKSGVREMEFAEDNDILNMYVNGRRLIGNGGNWGFPESNLKYRGREYDIAVAYHADMNFTMIRNWVGQTGDDEFYEACDRHGVMVWQDFWLANPADGPDPSDPAMFMKNAGDMVKRIRNHPSIGIYVGRNEGNPPEVIDTALRVLLPKIHPGIHYISNSASGVVSGGGPYRALPVRDYYLLYGFNKFHSERGMPNVMTYESLRQALPDSALWPQNSQWGIHDYCLESAQSAASFNQIIEKGFGPARDAKHFTELAQWINYNGYRGMFEGRSMYRQGLLLWMSHAAWPSMVWQTYDYYFEPTAAYFGCKKASEPVHIQWNPVFDTIEVVNYNGFDRGGLVAEAQIINMDGTVKWKKETTIDSNEDTTVKCFKLEFPADLSAAHFIKLRLREGARIISENFYWRGLEDGNYQALNSLPKVDLSSSTQISKSGKNWIIKTTLTNSTNTPALMVRLKVVGTKSGERILPAFFSDNYVSLMPGEGKEITINLKDEDTRGEKPGVEIFGFNL